MPRPCAITPDQVATARTRIAGGERLCDVARDLDVKRDALGYHVRGGKAAHYAGSPWTPHTKAAFRAIGSGDHAEAARQFQLAAEALGKFAG